MKNMNQCKGMLGIKSKNVVLLFLVVIAIAAAVFFVVFSYSSSIIVLTVNGEPVIKEEFQKRMQESKSIIFAYFAEMQGVSDSKSFWTNEYNGEVPLERLKSKVAEDIIKIRVEQILAKQNEIDSYMDYHDFKKRLKNENIRRKEAKNRNEPIYGPVQYEERVYYWYVLGNMVEELKKKLSKSTLAVTEQDGEKFYENNKKLFNAPFEEVKSIVNNKLVDQKYNDLISQMIDSTSVVFNMKVYNRLKFD